MRIEETACRYLRRAIGGALIAAVLALAWLVFPKSSANAQGFGPATTWNQLVTFSGASSTSVPAASDVVRNIGQSSHYFLVCANGSVATDSAQVQGSFDGSTWFPISTAISVAPGGCQSVSAGGYFPDVRLNISTLTGSGAAVSADYSGSVSLLPAALGVSSGDPCQDPTVLKQSAPISFAGTGNDQLVGPRTDGAVIYLCGAVFTLDGTAPVTAQLLEGRGTNCGSGASNLTGTFQPTPGSVLNVTLGGATVLHGTPSEAVCISLSGTNAAAQGVITYVVQ